jgi:carboxylate-amine ligase
MRTVGVEEELLLVDGESGRPRSVADRVVRSVGADGREDDVPGGSLKKEFQEQQLETDTTPHTDMDRLREELRGWRDRAIAGARESGARVVASGTSPLPVEPRRVDEPRFQRLAEHAGLTANEQMTCACHVHVAIESEEEGVGVLDRIRVWLPTILAISANSPFWQGSDSSYASYRSQVVLRWPTAGPIDVMGTPKAYHDTVAAILGTGVALDEGMLYLDARLSHHAPTVEIRVADVCLDVADAVVVAALCRALVDTAAAEWAEGVPAPHQSSQLLRLASWQAARHGITGDLLDPRTLRPRPSRTIVTELVEHVGAALSANGDVELVDRGLEQVFARGNGAIRQREVLAKTGQVTDVVATLARVTAGHGD